jgi:hypothetical protein
MTPPFTLETDPEVVVQHLRPLLMAVYEALEIAAPTAVEIVSERGWEATGHLTSHIVRAEVLRCLKERKAPFEVEAQTLEMDRVAMEGLSTRYEGIQVKILKGAEIPKPCTGPRRDFYQHSNPNLWVGGAVPAIRSLIVLWDCDAEGGSLTLQLCCTRNEKGHDMWMIPVPHPANWMEPVSTPNAGVTLDDLDELFVEDQNEEQSNG